MGNVPIKDEILLQQLAQGQTAALEVLYDSYARVVYSVAIKIVKDPGVTEDIVQEAFVRVWQGARTYDSSRGRVITWLLTITHNLCIDEVRRRKVRPQPATQSPSWSEESNEDPLLSLPDQSPGVEDQALNNVIGTTVREALRELPSEQYSVVEMAYFQGLTHTEIAQRLGLPLGTAKTRMALAIKKLKHILDRHGYNSPG